MIHLQTLGRLELRAADGERVQAVQTRPKDLALLTYLSLAGPFGFQRRDTLLALFWPDLDAGHGRNTLSQALHRLRTSLPEGVLVVDGREDVGVSPARLSSDAVSFEGHLEAGELPMALRLYEGDFLAGFHAPGVATEFEDWIVTERERLQRRAFNALLVLVEAEEKSGSEEAAIGWLRRALDMRPCDETICRRLIEALAAAGDRAGALAEYERFARRFGDEYGLSPSAETRAVPDAIRNNQVRGGRSEKPCARVWDPRVIEAFLKGRYFTSTMEQTARGLECLQHALELDPEYAPAYAATALSLANLAIMGHLPPEDARLQSVGAAKRALDFDPTLGDAHTAIGATAMVFDWDWSTAEREFRIAISLNPNSSDAHAYYAQFLCAVGRPDDGVAEAEAAQHLDPLGLWANFTLGWALFRARRHDESIERLRALLELYPHFAFAHLFIAENHLSSAAYAEATDACRTALEILPEDQLLLGLTACVMGLSGEQDAARILQRKLETLAHSRYVCPGHLAAAHLGLAERDRAFECWEVMYRNRSALAWAVPTDPLYDSVRDDVRFGELCDRMRIRRPAPERLLRNRAEPT
jgi:DNA-binding SARP family transcriptional activator/Tfp pilus assembly protein PilF